MSETFDACALAAPGIRNLAPYDPGKPIEELERQYGVRGAIKVASNENPYGPSPLAQRVLSATTGDIHRYPDGAGYALKTAIAQRHGVSIAQICLGNGSNDVLDMAARVFVSPGETGIISQHAFIVYYLSLIYAHADIKVIDALDFGHDTEQMAAAVDKGTKLIYIANPNNPTGTWSRADELRYLLDNVPENVITVVDEAYSEYVDDAQYPDCIGWLGDYPNLIVTRTFSKIFGLAALRIGYSVSSAQIADLLNRARQPFNCNTMGMTAAIESLKDEQYCQKCRQLNLEQMNFLVSGFDELNLQYIESVGNFICLDLGSHAANTYESLLRMGVITRMIGGYGLPDHLRISIGTAKENERVLEALNCLRQQSVI